MDVHFMDPQVKIIYKKLTYFKTKPCICMGAMRSTPIEPLHVEALEPPLKYRRNHLSHKFLIKNYVFQRIFISQYM